MTDFSRAADDERRPDSLAPEGEPLAGDATGYRTVAGDHRATPRSDGADGEPLVTDAAGFQRRWDSIKVGFVDDPRRAVAEAEALLTEVVDDLLTGFRRDREQLEQGWERGDEGSTEQLRRALRRYRTFYERLLDDRERQGGGRSDPDGRPPSRAAGTVAQGRDDP